MIRLPAVAGAFYPADPRVLRTQVETLLEAAPPSPSAGRLRALVVPHAGYVYSGAVAAHAYALLRRESALFDRVLLLGPAHRAALAGMGMSTAEAWRSPLGDVALDRAWARGLVEAGLARWSDEAHALEHSLEVQLPFLQAALGVGAFTLLPVAVGKAPPEAVAAFIVSALRPGTLLVVSTDLSHFLPYERARAADEATCRVVLARDAAALGHDDACGFYPLRGLLHWARGAGCAGRTLDLRNSGDQSGDRDRVVGYGAWAFEEFHGA